MPWHWLHEVGECVPCFWQCDFASLLCEWFEVLTDRLTCFNTWTVSEDYALYGLSTSTCPAIDENAPTFVVASIKLDLWRGRCDVLFRVVVRRSDLVLALAKEEIRLRLEADFTRLSGTAFGRKWGPLVSTRRVR